MASDGAPNSLGITVRRVKRSLCLVAVPVKDG